MAISALYDRLISNSSVAMDILSISIMLIAGFLMTRITKRLKLPNVTAYIVAGILIGPFALNLIPKSFVDGTDFLPDIALAFIAFGTGEFFRFETLKKNGAKVFVITLFEALIATLFVFVLCFFLFGLSLPFSLVLASLAAATAPASTMMTIRQTHAKGEFVDTLLQVVALDDMVGLVAYSVAISVATAAMSGRDIDVASSLIPFFINIGVLALGAFFGFLTYVFMKTRHSTDNRLIIAIAMLFSFCGICAVLETSPLLGCMAMGTVYINMTEDDKLFKQLNYFSPPILMLFFVRSGVSFDLGALFDKGSVGRIPLIYVGVGYFVVRILGKYVGAYSGSHIVGASDKVKKYLGLALIPQAGVAIGLAELGARTLGGDIGRALMTIILASSVLYELIGPAAAKAALYLSGSYGEEDREQKDDDAPNDIDVKIYIASGYDNVEERLYTEGAEEYYESQGASGDKTKKSAKSKKKAQNKNGKASDKKNKGGRKSGSKKKKRK
ncbi:MAG: cation:proton antiporter [Lachnospiraceae bacterium]|nr:cation:proton antiporter [Lachnospiraceae bacterium]